MTRDETLLIRLNAKEKAAFRAAAAVAGVGLSTWARERLRLAAVRELEVAGRKNPLFAEDGSVDGDDNED